MLYKETVEARTLDLIKLLVADSSLADFFMVGGTALSLQIGHRLSIDIDLFSQKDFDSNALKMYMEEMYNMTNAKAIKNGLWGFINDIKVDLIAHKYPLTQPLGEAEGIRMVSLQDIGAMKLHAIFQNGNRYKDFIDMYFLLEHQPLQVFADSYEKKYFPDANINLAKNGLIYFDDIDYNVPIKLIKESVSKETVQARLKEAVVNPFRIYQAQSRQETKRSTLRQRRRGPRP